jgi:hypothetical protein
MTQLSIGHRAWTRTGLVGATAFVWLVVAAGAHAAISVDASVSTHQAAAATTISAGPLSTNSAGDLLVAYVASDGPGNAGGQSMSSVTGGGLTWKLRARSNAQAGTAEIWEAVAPTTLSGVTITATRSAGSYGGSMLVVAYAGADTTADGAVANGDATTGAPSVSLQTTRAGSWVWGVGHDWDSATPRTVGSGQTKVDEYVATGTGDTYWVQSRTAQTAPSGSTVTINDTAPTTDRWDLASIEILAATPDTIPPTYPTNLTATATNANQVSLSWTASTDNVGVAGYTIYRNRFPIATSTGTTYVDGTVHPSTTYQYTVQAFDAAGNVSGQSTPPTSVTTPAASSNPPVISNVASSDVLSDSATITWTTDVPSSSQVLYGQTTAYGQSTTLSNALVTTHAQTITGLSPGTTYHFEVQSTGSSNNTGTSGDNQFATIANDVTLPDMQIEVPTNAISIGTNGDTGHRQLQFTHVTWDAGPGPFEIDPTYNAATGTATFEQAIYKSTSPGVWTLDHRVPLATIGQFHPPSDYQFPLTKFTLNGVNADGSLGSVVATSPKTDYCITGDTYVGGVPNTPNQTFIPQSNCTDPTLPLGWSVGWGDEYDQTDSGQPIDLTGVPDGTYVLRGIVDPDHVFTESDPTNDVTDTKLQIAGNQVTVLSQTQPGTTPPTVSITSPTNGATVSGTVTLSAAAAATSPATVSSVQYLLDGVPLGNPVTSAPYTYTWTIGSTTTGNHTLSARVTDSSGDVATSQAITVNVQPGPPPPPNNPTVTITNPAAGETVSGTVPVAANVTSNLPIASVQFFLDGTPLGTPVTSSPYSIQWDTTLATAGTHVLTATATDTSGDAGTSKPVSVTVQNPAPPMTCFVMQAQSNVHGNGTVTTPSFHTAAADEVLVAFVSADGPANVLSQSSTVSGAGLKWTLVRRANGQPGDAEVWEAPAPFVLANATVTSKLAKSGYDQSLTVIAMEGVSGVGAAVSGSSASGAPSVKLTTTGATSLVFAVGHDWDNAQARTLPPGWTMLDQWVDTGSGDTSWSQYTNTPTGAAGSVVTVGDTAPTSDRWDLVGVELLNDDN